MRPTVLVVDDDEGVRTTLRILLEERYDVLEVCDGSQAVARFADCPSAVVLLDLVMPGMDGFATLRSIRETDPDAAVSIITGLSNMESAVRAMQAGASDFLVKPLDPARVRQSVERLVEKAALSRDNRFLRGQLERAAGESVGPDSLIGSSAGMEAARKRLAQVAAADATVLIVGETGTGKELAARAIHRLGSRAKSNFVPVNCAAIPENLIESELFGHEKGAFTSADSRRIGMFEHADGGVLFLDEVNAMSPVVQPKLLRVLETGEVTRVGGTKPFHVDVQVLASSNEDLRPLVEQKRFREDLLFRLRVVEVRLPPLRDRASDLQELIEHLVPCVCRGRGRRKVRFTAEALDVLVRYAWPGNVRELRNLIEQLSVTGDRDEVGPEQLPVDFFVRPSDPSPEAIETGLRQAIRLYERRYIQRALERTGGNRSRTAKALGIHRNALTRKISDLDLR